MKHQLLLLAICLVYFNVFAQDDFHNSLQDLLQSNYNLPAGSWVLNDNEAANLNSDYWYGDVSGSDQSAAGQLFSQKVQLVVNSAGANQWDAGYGLQNTQTVNAGSNCLLAIWLRAEGGSGQVSLFVENSSNFEKEIYLTFDLFDQWTRYLVPFDANQTYSPGGLTAGLHVAWVSQTVEIGGLAILNYGTSVSMDDLPNETNNNLYGGWEPNAPWRSEAANRIEEIRKSNATIRVEDENGVPVSGASVEVEMLSHDYAFGTAVVSRLFAGNNSHNPTYESKLLDLDGEGHGFNWVVFENALKWPGWEQNWITTPPETAHAVQWLRDHDIFIRGHTLVWPGWSNLPPDLEDNQNNHTYIKERFNDHIEEIITYPGIEGNIAEWDVLNEITTNRDLEYTFQGEPGYPTGREIYVDIFDKLAEVDPNTKTYINDYVTISQANTGGGNYDLKKQFTQELLDAGVQLDGIGFQGHIGGFPTSIYDVYGILEDFYTTFGLTAKITEYDTNEAMSDELAATYLRDFLTIVFSHESTDGFLMWGFWDGAHWHGNAPLFYQDWTLKPAGETFIDMVYDEWWTEENGLTNPNGEFGFRGFKGKYQVTIDCGDEVLVDTFTLRNDMTIIKTNGALVTDLDASPIELQLEIFPNPAKDFLYVTKQENAPAEIHIFDSSGKLVYSNKMTVSQLEIPLQFGKGAFEVVIKSRGTQMTETLIIQ